ncbi:molybdopterin cofactor-binding domain-containing protein [Phenylobacterium sp. J367]|uniref:molybdopterin cofactor-binding domain-containing protein n=1 Tax=Phenylobacterium sp. J367 TaxID=2898435 RepID=UPI0021508601|nr:molybdopterin cofactor-binding domain-containing protein [Phenylobacterium sp. J367]
MAFVLAETLEQAQAAAALVRIDYDARPPEVDFREALSKATDPHGEEDVHIGDVEAALASAPVTLDDTWFTPIQNHCQMEPCATTAWWEGGTCVVHTSVQMVKPAQHGLAETLKIGRDDVRLLTRYIGGGFGGRARPTTS